GPGNYYLLATGGDGAATTIAWFEVTPRISGKQILLAFEQDGEPVRNGLRLVVPGDDLGGRSLAGLATLELRNVDADPPPDSATDGIALEGMVERAATLALDDLARFATHEVETQPSRGHSGEEIPSRRYSGVRLWDVIEDAGPILDP